MSDKEVIEQIVEGFRHIAELFEKMSKDIEERELKEQSQLGVGEKE